MLRCGEIDLSAYHDRALSESELRQIDIHLQYCAKCMSRYGQEVKLINALTELPPIDPPKHFIPHLMYRVRQEIYSQIVPAEERRFSLLTAGYGLALLILIVFVGGIQKAFVDAAFGWAELPLKSMLAVLRTMNTVTESGSHLLVSTGPILLPTLLLATFIAGFMLVRLLTHYERTMLNDVRPPIRRSVNEKIS